MILFDGWLDGAKLICKGLWYLMIAIGFAAYFLVTLVPVVVLLFVGGLWSLFAYDLFENPLVELAFRLWWFV